VGDWPADNGQAKDDRQDDANGDQHDRLRAEPARDDTPPERPCAAASEYSHDSPAPILHRRLPFVQGSRA
jgi:hypothetical protein